MAFTREKTAFQLQDYNPLSVRTTSRLSESMLSTLSETTGCNDDLEEDSTKSRTFIDSPWTSHETSTSRLQHNPYLGARKSLYSGFNRSKDLEVPLRKPSFQEQYWACAIPDTPPPRPDRASPNWNPNKEYQELLDYTYPINPKYFISKDSEETDSDALFHDSGIGLDSCNVSFDSRLHSASLPYQEHTFKRDRYTKTTDLSPPYAFSTPLQKVSTAHRLQYPSESSNEESFEGLSSCASKVDFVKESTYNFTRPKCTLFDNSRSLTNSGISTQHLQKSHQFIPTTKILSLHNNMDSDEEYLSLPSNLKELENLATHLKHLSLTVNKSKFAGRESRPLWLLLGDPEDHNAQDIKTRSMAGQVDFRDSRFESELPGRKETRTSFTNFSSLRDMLNSPTIEDVHENKSLVQSIQKFCHHLDKLIQWLHSITDIANKWSAPEPDVESIQSSLSLYLKFKKDIMENQVLAYTVVKDGELLLNQMSVNSSILKDTLSLVSKQSRELERQAERLYASVLDAMDTVTDDSPGRHSNQKQCVSVGMESR